MTRTRRRRFLEQVAAGAALSAAAPALATAGSLAQGSGRPPGAGPYDYLGRSPGYKDWAVVPRGLTVKSVETFQRESLALVRITASDGKVGWGQIAPYEADISAMVLHRLIARRVVGKDIADIDAINDDIIDAQLKFPWSFLCRALAGVDTALWDLYGQITGKPVAVLLGGKVGPLPAYGSSMRRDISPADEATRLAKLRDTFGCKAFKIRLGTPGGRNKDAAPGRSEAIIPAVRKAVGPDIELHADANSCYTPDVAIAMGRRLEDARYAAFEEPCPYWELEWTREVTQALEDRRPGRRAGQRHGPVAPHDRDARRGHRPARHLLRRRPDPRLARRQDGRSRRPRDQAARGQRLARHRVHDAPAGGAAQGRRGRVLDRGRRGDHPAGAGDVRSDARDEGRARRDAATGPGWGVRIKPDWLAGANRQITPA